MKKFAGLIIILFVFGCAHISVQPVCRHTATLCAITYSDLTDKQVGIAVGYWNSTTGGRHAQAFSIDEDGKLIWLILFHGEVQVGEKDNFTPYVFLKVREFEDRYVRVKEFDKNELDRLLRQLYSKRLE